MPHGFRFRRDPGRLQKCFGLAIPDDGAAEIQDFAPASLVATIEWNAHGRPVLQMARFGFRMREGVLPMINYRCESIDPLNPSRAFLEGRCIVPVDLFCTRVVGPLGAQEIAYGASGGKILGLAAMLRPETGGMSVTVLTVPATSMVRSANGRMPAILSDEDYAVWLDDTTSVEEALAITRHNNDDLIVEMPD